MKRIIILFSVFALVLTSCVHDDTNENFIQLNEAAITGIADEYNNVYVDDFLKISPVISTTKNDLSQFSYFWITYDTNTLYNADTLSHQKDLNVKIGMIPGKHTVVFKAVDNKTGIFYKKQFVINVVNEFTNGIMVLYEKNGSAELGFWSQERGKLISDIYGKLNEGGTIGQRPQRVYFNKYSDEKANEVLILCQDQKGGVFLDATTMQKTRDYKDFFFAAPDEIKPQAYYKANMREYLIDNGLAYDRATNSTIPNPTVKPNLSVAGKNYEIAGNADFGDPEVGHDDYPARIILYDNKNMCFYSVYKIASAFMELIRGSENVIYEPGGFFDPNNVGMTCLYANISARSATGAREYMGVFQTPQGKRHLLRMGIGFWVENAEPDTYFKDMGNDVITSEGIDAATTFACSPKVPGYMFYASGNALYLYNAINNAGQEVYKRPEGQIINHIEIDRSHGYLLVAYQDKEKQTGKAGFVMLEISTDGGLKLAVKHQFDAVGDKILDFENRY